MSYASAAALARCLLGKKGKAITITRTGQGTINAIAGSRGVAGDLTGTFKCVGLPPGPNASKEIGSLVDRRMMEFHLARTAGDLEPEPGDRIPWGTKTYTLIWAANYDPDDNGLVYSKAYGEAGG
jgi:hypothetical protein